MSVSTHQLTGIVRNEVVMQWRRGSLRAIVVTLFGAALLWWLMIETSSLPQGARPDALNADQRVMVFTAQAIISTLAAGPILTCVVTVIAADAIAIDRQYGMSEVLGGLPLGGGTYLIGKLLSAWLPLAGMVLLTGLALGLLNWQTLGAYDAGAFAAYWLGAMLPTALFASGASMLWAAGQSTRQRAALVGFVFIFVCMVALALLTLDFVLAAGTRTIFAVSMPDRLASAPNYPDVLSPGYLIRLVIVFGFIVVSAFIARLRLEQQK